ncbi:PAS domain S-box protein [Mucilaginibacter terrae]|uniref:PAS domain S-box protein n=1 Tax=Mucilaginibacter terrae TaxID=1955052 RepID=UPI003641B3B2
MVKNLWLYYQQSVKGKTISRIAETQTELSYWQDLLFFNFLFYCLPVSLIAVIPGVYMSVKEGYTVIAIVDVISLILLSIVTFTYQISLQLRKLFVIIIFYILSVFLIYLLGYIGPGVFYLFAITILISLIFCKKYAYWSILVNTFILSFFAVVIQFKLFNSPINQEYTSGKWIAFSSNLIFLSIILVNLINRIFKGLQETINTMGQLQERYKNIFDQSPTPMWIFDTSSLKFLEVNKAAIRNYGYSESEFLQMTIKDIHPQNDVADLEDLVETNRKSGLFYHGTSKHLKKDGEYIHVKIESNLLVIDGKQVRIVLATDITHRVKSELEVYHANLKIKRSEANLRAIFESAADGFVLLDEELNVKAFNVKAKAFILLNKNQPQFEVGQTIFNYIEISKQENFRSAIQRVFAGKTVEYDRYFCSDPESALWIRFTLTPFIEDQLIKGVCITGRDVTVRKLYLQNQEDQNKTFREISWMQSHVVRAPLARIMGLIDILKTLRDDDFENAIDYIHLSACELDEIIKKITLESNSIINKYPLPTDVKNHKN